MRRISFIAFSLLCAFLPAGAPVTAQTSAPATACPHVYDFEHIGSDDVPDSYALVLAAYTPLTASAQLTVYADRTAYVVDLPAVDVTKPSDVRYATLRSPALVLHLPASYDSPSLVVRYVGRQSACPAQGVSTGSVASQHRSEAMQKPGNEADLHASIRSEAAAAKPIDLTANPQADATCAHPFVSAGAIDAVTPQYPELPRVMGVGGTALISVTLDANGFVTATSVYRSSGSDKLDSAAVTAAQSSTYRPIVIGCTALSGTYIFRAEFRTN